ncbi:hypothetical protein GUJ93_ZPchr0006g44804 [Zizania palustris]|uniref:Polymerase nucleotidyl transferase domain-containing protein n=1 Tax=Zizania palustris TaxID=103762 RepID=A0A8J5SJR9_ZIZPA|nr:hypothetical protein GUJ93_ZPchr0006g44804 [Zizania palustris]
MGMVPNGLLPNASAGVTRQLDDERWAIAEARTAELIACIQPNAHSERRRDAVYNYVQGLIVNCLSCQVFTFGSVPLKTYLPDGDIDVTAFSYSEELKTTWAKFVQDALEREEKNEKAKFRVKEVQYIQAEVKIIKCLVDNIVVDISFNQVGGLCTLCFLDEVDALISNNHLFKRSIILIKAWCFYESRILGAHHGLISTYALETLVLYIFHVFNNCFTGPLEVLYRFLEFFSNFDWERFCLSLWGPVPISSLPDMTAEAPRLDGGDLLLSKSFLDKCSYSYAVTPRIQPIQESQIQQPFVSKHFNVIDPLRTNNNLGRSVSKGNYFRIRSAFSFGAKRLAKVLECPKEDLIAEVNRFFTNTWIRHGSGNRPDAPTPNLILQHPLNVPAEASNNQRSAISLKKKAENPNLRANQDNLTEGAHNYPPEVTSQPLQRSDLHSRNATRTVNPVISHSHQQKVYASHANTKVSEQLERNRSDGSVQNERDKGIPNSLFANDRNGQNRSRFARTHSSPELTDTSIEGYSHGRRTRAVEMEKSLKVDYNNRRNNLAPEVSSSHITKSSQDESMPLMNSSSHHSVSAVSDSHSVSGSYHEDNGFGMNDGFPSVSETSEKEQEEQVLVDLMASTKLHDFNGHNQLPMEIPSHLSVAPSPLLAPTDTAYSQKHFAGIPSTSLIGAPWPNMQLLHGYGPPPMTHYMHNHTFAPSIEDGNESEKPITSDANRDDGNNWHEYRVGLPRYFNHQGRDPQLHHFHGKEHSTSPSIVSGAPLEMQVESAVEDCGGVENYTNMFQNQTSRQVSINAPVSSGNARVPSSQASLSIDKSLQENPWDELDGKTSGSLSDKWGKMPAFAAPATPTHGKNNTGWQTGNATVHIPPEVDGSRNGVTIPNIGNESSDIIIVSGSITSRASQVPNDFEPSQMGMRSPMFAPFLIGSTQQRQADSSKLTFIPTGPPDSRNSKLTFIPTGPPVPYVMLPYVPGNGDGSVPQFERNEGADQLPVNIAVQNFGSLNDVQRPDTNAIPMASSSTVGDPSDEQRPDILNSDFGSHLHNLQYGRSCQNPRPMNPVFPFAVPPMYLQGHVPWDGSGRPASANVNWTQIMPRGQQIFPVMPPPPSSERVTGVPQHYVEDAPRYRGGTGTYLPNPKIPFRDRHSSSRNHRGSYNSDKGDHSDKEGNWINSRQRNPGRSYGRNHFERTGMRSDRQTTDETQYDRQRRSYRNDSYRHEAGAQSSGSTNYIRKPGNMTRGDPSPSASNVPTADVDILPVTRQAMTNGFGQRHVAFRGGSSHSSPDQPSSPQPRR